MYIYICVCLCVLYYLYIGVFNPVGAAPQPNAVSDIYTHVYIYIYIHVHIYVCVFVCVILFIHRCVQPRGCSTTAECSLLPTV